ncbi:MAG: hypothetical protein QX196_05560 [Methylococcaceae bacterium]
MNVTLLNCHHLNKSPRRYDAHYHRQEWHPINALHSPQQTRYKAATVSVSRISTGTVVNINTQPDKYKVSALGV